MNERKRDDEIIFSTLVNVLLRDSNISKKSIAREINTSVKFIEFAINESPMSGD